MHANFLPVYFIFKIYWSRVQNVNRSTLLQMVSVQQQMQLTLALAIIFRDVCKQQRQQKAVNQRITVTMMWPKAVI